MKAHFMCYSTPPNKAQFLGPHKSIYWGPFPIIWKTMYSYDISKLILESLSDGKI